MKKRRQHHVWQRYLKSWATKNQLYCLRDSKIFLANTNKVASERDFYKLHKLNPENVDLIKSLIISNSPSSRKQAHEDFLNRLVTPVQLVEENRDKLRDNGEIDEKIDEYRTNVLEDYHSNIENSFVPLLRRVLDGEINFYSTDKDCIDFLYFLSTQYMRTKGGKLKIIEKARQETGLDLASTWDIMALMLSDNIGFNLFVERKKRKLVLVHNNTGVEFITGDQPVINLYANASLAPERLALYYPVSPRLALVLGDVNEEPPISTEPISSAEASDLNLKMLDACHSQVFGHSKSL